MNGRVMGSSGAVPARTAGKLVPRKCAGITLMELLVYAAILAVVAMGILASTSNVFSGQRVEEATREIERVKLAAEAFRRAPAQAGLYTGITVTILANRGYNVEPFTTGTNQNAYGLTTTIAPAASNTDATLTYAFDNAEDCAQMIDRYTGVTGVKTTPTCTTNTLSITLE